MLLSVGDKNPNFALAGIVLSQSTFHLVGEVAIIMQAIKVV